ncbi:MAG: hypothetical protein ACK47B_07990 [Armatimonadota bacterium]
MQTVSRLALISSLLLTALAAHAAAPAPSASDVLARVERRLAAVEDYSYVLESEVRGPKKRSHGTYQIWVRKPNLFRLKVQRGQNEGSEIAVTPRGTVDARPGGLLKHLVTKSMDKHDPRLRSPRGAYAWESTFSHFCSRLRQSLGRAGSASTAPASGSKQLAVTLSYRHPQSGRAMRETWTVDSGDWKLTGFDVWEDGVQVEKCRLKDCRLNLGLKEKFFDL